ncbi:DUF1707 domain-containing protein [Actinophytocola sp. NPDC049390]|uniref:DUF1707 SHOCT-like domain-containing protein n=1 Tax=Actinophytocola sp. NPDC049390 TaxID=3363894 RepID=UPI00379D215A
MSEPPAVPDPREMRVSNADREHVAQVLNDAMAEGRLTVEELEERLDKVYAAKVFRDLEPLVRDLPVGGQAPQLPVPAAASPAPVASARIGGRGTSSAAVAVMSGAVRKGMWTVPPTFTSFAFWGGVQIDLTDARFEDPETTIQAYALMGGVEIFVPDDIVVQVNGVGFMGAFDNKVENQSQPRPGAPIVKVNGLAFWGGVEVKRRKRKKEKRQIEE